VADTLASVDEGKAVSTLEKASAGDAYGGSIGRPGLIPRSGDRRARGLLAWVCSWLMLLTACGDAGSDARPSAADEVWALEQAIYAKRAAGDTLFYSDISSEHYLGWPAPAVEPVSYASIREFALQGSFEPGEKIAVVSNGISVDGDTAISYYTTHRTVRPGGLQVDERYENIHVYVRRDDEWRLVGAMSRRLLPDQLGSAPLGSPDQ